MTSAFDDWKARALQSDIVIAAIQRGAKLKRVGREYTGPCPACGGTDRFSINLQKGVFNCRGAEGGDVIKMVMHLDGVSFTQACEALTAEPPPSGQSKPLSDAERESRDKARAESQRAQRAREAAQRGYEENTREAALAIWNRASPIQGTLAESYLRSRGIHLDAYPDVLRFHPILPYPDKDKTYPALVCRVDDVAGEFTALWRIYLREDGRKADVPNPKLGLGPARGGAVRIGGIGSKIAIAEGVESALGYWLLTGRKHPAWSGLSTSGLIGFEAPLGVEHVIIAPDGDRPMKKHGHEYVPAEPAGRKAALALRERLLAEGIACTIAAEPSAGKDYLDLWNEHLKEVA